MRLLFIGDVHLADDPPSSRIDDYNAAILKKLEQCVKIANQGHPPRAHVAGGCTAWEGYYRAVVFMGDLFHIKDPYRNSHALVYKFLEVLDKFIPPVYGIEGNHDLEAGHTSTLSSQPLGVVFKSEKMFRLDKDTHITKLGSNPPDDQIDVVLSPLAFAYETEYSVEALKVKRNPHVDLTIKVSHSSILPQENSLLQGKDRMPHIGAKESLIDADMGYDLLVNGHIHNPCDMLTGQSNSFVNTGAIARGSIGEGNLTRIPKVLEIEVFKRGRFTHKWHELDVVPANKVFRVEEIRQEKEAKGRLDAFVQGMKEGSEIQVTQAHSFNLAVMLEEYLATQKVPAGVVERVRSYIQKVS